MEENKMSLTKKEKSCQETNELELVKKVQRQFSDAKEKYQSQDLKDKNGQSKRFDSFINQKEISTT